jgi:hypothetical protein
MNEAKLLHEEGGRAVMRVEGDWFSARLSTRAGRFAARMWAYTKVTEGEAFDAIASALLDEAGREEHRR